VGDCRWGLFGLEGGVGSFSFFLWGGCFFFSFSWRLCLKALEDVSFPVPLRRPEFVEFSRDVPLKVKTGWLVSCSAVSFTRRP